MARIAKPWFREDRNAWFVNIRGRRHNLGPDKTEAYRLFHELMAHKPEAPKAPRATGLTVAEVYDKYLDWCERNRSPRSYQWYVNHIQLFLDHLTDPAGMPALDLRPFHVVEHVDGHSTWGANQRRGAIVALTRPFNWSAKMGYIDHSPVRGVEKPQATKRDSKLTPEDFAALIGLVRPKDPFHDLLSFAWESGCRPQEARHVEARHVHLQHHRIEIPAAEAKGKSRWRVIYLSPSAEAIVQRMIDKHPSGKLFRNVRGREWKVDAVGCRFGRLKEKLGTRFAAYDLRHAFATRKLKEGVDPITVASLLGHKDATMLCKHYEGVSGDGEHLLGALRS
jgi:integrase